MFLLCFQCENSAIEFEACFLTFSEVKEVPRYWIKTQLVKVGSISISLSQ